MGGAALCSQTTSTQGPFTEASVAPVVSLPSSLPAPHPTPPQPGQIRMLLGQRLVVPSLGDELGTQQ